ncbi:tRNA (adenosine(37)-N6)-threonylcarbamoyltransferase complex dimerization subunit type 1 TsaB [Mangrovibacillus cuniculi]|uniref:tRNA (Adenosine(37)-N6)-threonylcarbamoyltransferase complex dimerization subunit type 1 TsaB n=1 Tax=Mangrovibacillus cuniculi TaxID=2593652 RepID=A0A7S8HH29_9BACI|nr:tRNA (adenosine(37)-N6)-threonylcarbamoyltransferase complex dimerization subunit type 1 TsaB [Mangrovibacillus cuniculi]QPC48201.1 tRNA (adenosine(37)-N6)-threonylcarbamoyltransferase complex dimerization subunit type 1 TsaB [Mangrovibacillus cuniculi]
MITLAIDTSHYPLSVALVSETEFIGERTIHVKKNHSVRVMPTIEEFLKECEVTQDQISRVAVAKGPGSYTGLRIGVTIAKTLAWSWNVPLVGVSSLLSICGNARFYPELVCPIFDARRGLVYTGLYSFTDGQPKTMKEDTNILLTDWLEELSTLQKNILFVGNDLVTFKQEITNVLGDRAQFVSNTASMPSAAWIAEVAQSLRAEDVHTFEPSYVRLAEAEAKWQEEQEKSNGQ